MSRSSASELGYRLWRTADGKTVRWKDMDIDHLANTYHMLRRQNDGMKLNIAAAYILGGFDKSVSKESLKDFITRASADKAGIISNLKAYIEYRVHKQEKSK